MFGQNPIRSKTSHPEQLSVEDIFYTIQGEGPLSGQAALFIRMAGCNLACHYCDTQFETKADQVEPLATVMDHILVFPEMQRKLVVLTGGEPLRQDISLLIKSLLETGTKLVQIETAGTLWQPGLEELIESGQVMIVCSPKTPKVNPAIITWCRHWKYVIIDDGGAGWDGLPGVGTQINNMRSFQPLYRAPGRPDDVVWVSPCDQKVPELNARNQQLAVRLCMEHGYRLSLQVHKIINVP